MSLSLATNRWKLSRQLWERQVRQFSSYLSLWHYQSLGQTRQCGRLGFQTLLCPYNNSPPPLPSPYPKTQAKMSSLVKAILADGSQGRLFEPASVRTHQDVLGEERISSESPLTRPMEWTSLCLPQGWVKGTCIQILGAAKPFELGPAELCFPTLHLTKGLWVSAHVTLPILASPTHPSSTEFIQVQKAVYPPHNVVWENAVGCHGSPLWTQPWAAVLALCLCPLHLNGNWRLIFHLEKL